MRAVRVRTGRLAQSPQVKTPANPTLRHFVNFETQHELWVSKLFPASVLNLRVFSADHVSVGSVNSGIACDDTAVGLG